MGTPAMWLFGTLGALIAVGWGDYHNEHVNTLAAHQWVVNPRGFVILAGVGFLIGMLTAKVFK